jgi:tetratricopeptide (TPR) repeat protein
MEDQALFDLISASSDPAAEIDRLAGHMSTAFVENMNATCMHLAQQGQWDDAIMLNGWALLALKHIRNPLLRAHTLYNRGQYFGHEGEWEKAEDSYREAMPSYEEEGSPTDILDCASLLMGALEKQGKKADQLTVAKWGFEKSGILPSHEAPDDSFKALREIGHHLRRLGESRLAQVCFEILLGVARRLDDIELEADANGILAEVFNEEGDLENAVLCLRRALELDRQIGNWKLEVIDLANLAFFYFKQGDLEESASLYAHCLNLRDEHDFVEDIEIDLKHYYHVCHYLGRKGEALALFKRYYQLSALTGELSEGMDPLTYLIYMDDRGRTLEGQPTFARFGEEA